MTDDNEQRIGMIKIKRIRRRVYEQALTDTDAGEAAIISLPQEACNTGSAPASRQQEALELVRKYVFWSTGAGLAPIPFIDMLAVVAIQSRMLNRLCVLYGLNYSEQRAKSFVTSLIGGFHAGLIACSVIRLIPIVGFASLAAVPAANGALTYAVGRVFIQHFESGGTFLDFDPSKVRRYFVEQFEDGGRTNKGAESHK